MKREQEQAESGEEPPIRKSEGLNSLQKRSLVSLEDAVKPLSELKDYSVKSINPLLNETFGRLREARAYRDKLKTDAVIIARLYIDGYIYYEKKIA